MQVEFFVCVDGDGDMGFGVDATSASDNYRENICDQPAALRHLRFVLEVPTPIATTLTGAVPVEGEVAMQVS